MAPKRNVHFSLNCLIDNHMLSSEIYPNVNPITESYIAEPLPAVNLPKHFDWHEQLSSWQCLFDECMYMCMSQLDIAGSFRDGSTVPFTCKLAGHIFVCCLDYHPLLSSVASRK